MAISKISESAINGASVEKNLADRPSSQSRYGDGGLTPKQVKAAYDRLPRLVAEYYNALVEAVESGELAELLPTDIKDEHSLRDLFTDITSGAFATYVRFSEGLSLDAFFEQTRRRISSGKGKPTSLTEGVVGGIYVLEGDSPAFYVCTHADDGIYTWRAFDIGSGIRIDDSVNEESKNAVSSSAVYEALEEKEAKMKDYLAERPVSRLISLSSSDWVNKSQTVTVSELGRDDSIILSPVTRADMRAAGEAQLFANANSEGRYVTFSCENLPSGNIDLYAVIIKG